MDITHITLGKANPQRMNGVNKVVYELCSHQAEAGNNVELWGITATIEENFPPRNFITKLFKSNKFRFILDEKIELEIIASNPKTIFHLHGVFLPELFQISKLLKKHHRKFVFTAHGGYNIIAMQKSGWQKKLYISIFEKKLLKNAAFINCLGESEVSGTKSILPNANTYLLPYGFDLIQFASQPKNEKYFTIAFCGRIDFYTKGLDAVLDGFKLFLKDTPNARLRLIGDGLDKNLVIDRINAEFEPNIIDYVGSKYGDEKLKLIAESDVFIHPSRNEGLPTAVLEAASLGLPSLVTKATNIGNYIQKYNAGIVIDKTDGVEVYKGLQELYKLYLSNKVELQNNAKQMVIQEFNWKHIQSEFEKMYQKALN
jgi:glycosyltransferase involved in cell wall biosynthesis